MHKMNGYITSSFGHALSPLIRMKMFKQLRKVFYSQRTPRGHDNFHNECQLNHFVVHTCMSCPVTNETPN